MTPAESMDKVLMVINIAEVLPELSSKIMAAMDGISYDAMFYRRVTALHAQLVELASLATESKYNVITEKICIAPSRIHVINGGVNNAYANKTYQ